MTSTEGIILRRIPYRSSGAVIDILTPTGKTGALLKGLDKKNSAVRQAETEPGTIADFILYPAKNPDSLSIVKELDVVPGTSPAGLTPLGAAQLMFICERHRVPYGAAGRPDAVRFPQAMYLFIALR